MSTLQLPVTDEAVFTEDEDEEYDERQHYEYQERNTEDYRSGDTEDYRNGDTDNYRNGDTEEYHGTYEEDARERQNTEDDEERPKEYESLRTEYDPDQVSGGYETPPKVAGIIATEEADVTEPERSDVYKTICENLRHTLASIKSYSKVNMMGDAKASYFTIGKFCQLLAADLLISWMF